MPPATSPVDGKALWWHGRRGENIPHLFTCAIKLGGVAAHSISAELPSAPASPGHRFTAMGRTETSGTVLGKTSIPPYM